MKTFRGQEGSGIRLITHQSSCEFSAAVGHRRERERTEITLEGRDLWAALKAPFFPFPRTERFSLLLAQHWAAQPLPVVFWGRRSREKSLSLSLSRSALSFTPLTLSLSLLPSCALCYSSFLSLHIFFHCPTSCALCISLSGCEFGCVCACINGFTLSSDKNQICTKMWISYACLVSQMTPFHPKSILTDGCDRLHSI